MSQSRGTRLGTAYRHGFNAPHAKKPPLHIGGRDSAGYKEWRRGQRDARKSKS